MVSRNKIHGLYLKYIVYPTQDKFLNRSRFVLEIFNLMVKASTKERPVLEVGRIFMYAGERVLVEVDKLTLNDEEKDRLYGELELHYRGVLGTIKECA